MTERRRRGASRSSNCFQTSSAFGFLAFIVRSRVGIRGVPAGPGSSIGSFTSKRKDKDLTPRPGPDRIGIPGKSRGAQTTLRSGQVPCTEATEKKQDALKRAPTRIWDDQNQRCRGKMRRKMKKGKTASSRSFTRKLLYQNENSCQVLFSVNFMQ